MGMAVVAALPEIATPPAAAPVFGCWVDAQVPVTRTVPAPDAALAAWVDIRGRGGGTGC